MSLYVDNNVDRRVYTYEVNNSILVIYLSEPHAINERFLCLDSTAHNVMRIGTCITNHMLMRGDIYGADSLWKVARACVHQKKNSTFSQARVKTSRC